jgi:hypothetical protein
VFKGLVCQHSETCAVFVFMMNLTNIWISFIITEQWDVGNLKLCRQFGLKIH